MDDIEIKWLVVLLLTAAAAGLLWYFRDVINPPPPATVEPQSVTTDDPAKEPLHPIEPLRLAPGTGELIELPPLHESDSYFALALIDICGRELKAMLSDEALIDKSVASIDNLTHDRVPEKIRPVDKLAGSFAAVPGRANGTYYLSPENYSRYDGVVRMLTRADLDELVAMYRRYYPLIQEAYVRLGYPHGYFNDRVVEVIDHLLATPEPEDPIELVQPHVLYEFADPELEALSSGQKLLLRMGGEHAQRVKTTLEEIKTRIATQQSP